MNNPWECPRCKRINAPFNPSCFCDPSNRKSHPLDAVGKALDTELLKKLQAQRCLVCNGYHGNGLSCMTLQVTS